MFDAHVPNALLKAEGRWDGCPDDALSAFYKMLVSKLTCQIMPPFVMASRQRPGVCPVKVLWLVKMSRGESSRDPNPIIVVLNVSVFRPVGANLLRDFFAVKEARSNDISCAQLLRWSAKMKIPKFAVF